MERIKKIAKYTLNTLTICNALLLGLSPIWELDIAKITSSIIVICSVISVYLLGGKAIDHITEHERG